MSEEGIQIMAEEHSPDDTFHVICTCGRIGEFDELVALATDTTLKCHECGREYTLEVSNPHGG